MKSNTINKGNSQSLEQSLISRPASEALKGFLMILIIIGHLRGLPIIYKVYLNSFHFQCFFILPFLYPVKHLDRRNVANLALKLLWPFLLLYVLQILINIFILHDSYFIKHEDLLPGINNTLLGVWSIFTGGINLIGKFCGSQFLWFLPAFFSMSILRMWYLETDIKPVFKVLLFIAGFGCYTIYIVFMYGIPIVSPDFFLIIQALSPLSIWQGLGFLVLGLSVLYLVRNLSFKRSYPYWTIAIIISLLFIIFVDIQAVSRILKFLMPIGIFLALYSSREVLAKSTLFTAVGHRSLAIYLIHPFLCILAGMLFPEKILEQPIPLLVEFLVVFGVSYCIAVFIDKVPLFRNILFPNGEEIGFMKSTLFKK